MNRCCYQGGEPAGQLWDGAIHGWVLIEGTINKAGACVARRLPPLVLLVSPRSWLWPPSFSPLAHAQASFTVGGLGAGTRRLYPTLSLDTHFTYPAFLFCTFDDERPHWEPGAVRYPFTTRRELVRSTTWTDGKEGGDILLREGR